MAKRAYLTLYWVPRGGVLGICTAVYRGGILTGKINFWEKFCPLGVWKGKKKIRREAPKKFLAYLFIYLFIF